MSRRARSARERALTVAPQRIPRVLGFQGFDREARHPINHATNVGICSAVSDDALQVGSSEVLDPWLSQECGKNGDDEPVALNLRFGKWTWRRLRLQSLNDRLSKRRGLR